MSAIIINFIDKPYADAHYLAIPSTGTTGQVLTRTSDGTPAWATSTATAATGFAIQDNHDGTGSVISSSSGNSNGSSASAEYDGGVYY